MQNNNEPQFWTLTITAQVCAGDMDKDTVINQAQTILADMTDGSDIMSIAVINAERDTL